MPRNLHQTVILSTLLCLGLLTACQTSRPDEELAPAQIGIVNHTDKFIYFATVNGSGGGTMSRMGAGTANICCTSIPVKWRPGLMVRVEWDMPEGIKDVIKEKDVEVEKYDEPGDVYMHFFPNDEVRVVVSVVGPYNPKYPITPPPFQWNEPENERSKK